MNEHRDDFLGAMNASVALVILIPLLLLLAGSIRARTDTSGGRARAAHDYVLPAAPLNDQPPVISISEAQVFSFPSGTAEIAPDFRRFLVDAVIPKLVDLTHRYGCDVVEVIGHTDSQRVRTRSNLDDELLVAIAGGRQPLQAGSNADLGLMRAWTVAELLKKDGRLGGKVFYSYSAADAISPGGSAALASEARVNEPARRRIEIRLRRR
jgi:hypothetical protein